MAVDTGRITRVEVEGLSELQASFRKAGASVEDRKGLNRQIGETLVPTGRRLAPMRTGRTKASIRAEATASAAVFIAGRTNMPWVPVVHFGWVTRGLGAGRTAEHLIGALGSKGSRTFSDKTLRKAARGANRTTRAKKGKVRGGPIAPNPWMYEALDQRSDAIFALNEKHVDGIVDAFNAGRI